MTLHTELEARLAAILGAGAGGDDAAIVLGRSREGRPVHAYGFGQAGRGAPRVSLLAGCHADEPVGPRLLRQLVAYLASLDPEDPLVADLEWWIVPHINPDGEARNRAWQTAEPESYDLASYLRAAVRELPGDDIEFGFPRDARDAGARPENRCVYDWWSTAAGPFSLHVSLHGMAVAAGPWFLLDRAWVSRCTALMARCRDRTRALGYRLHDVERLGEKGFERIERGFCTRPDSGAMRAYFEERGDLETARLFRPSSMETVRSLAGALGGDALTLVSEMPLFLIPGVGERLGPPDPAAERWRTMIESWREALASGESAQGVREEAATAGARPMPVKDQMTLQWELITAGVEAVETSSR
jgi:hypothetical protein